MQLALPDQEHVVFLRMAVHLVRLPWLVAVQDYGGLRELGHRHETMVLQVRGDAGRLPALGLHDLLALWPGAWLLDGRWLCHRHAVITPFRSKRWSAMCRLA